MHFAPLELKSRVVYKNEYGAGKSTDVLIDGLARDFAGADCTMSGLDVSRWQKYTGSYIDMCPYQKSVFYT